MYLSLKKKLIGLQNSRAHRCAVLRSIIDTTIKNYKEVLEGLSLLHTFADK